jgi:single-strand DNA-binding protein
VSGGMNKVQLLGYLGRDPEAKSFQNGGELVKLSIGTSKSWKDRASGERREKTEWHQVMIHSEGLIGLAKRYLRKGSRVMIEGELQTRKWTDQRGEDRYVTEIVVAGYQGLLIMLDKAGGGDRGGDDRDDRSAERSAPPTGQEPVDLDDDVPF